MITCWIGISTDESHRMKDSLVGWVENRYPLIDARISRDGCLAWMKSHGYPQPPRSACVFCPYHSDREWLRLKTEEPEAFALAATWEKEYQSVIAKDEATEGIPFLHRSLIKIDEIDFKPLAEIAQPNLFGNECEGMCGV